MSFVTNTLKTFARDWRVKLAVQNTLGLLPGSAGFRMNELLTQFVRGGIQSRHDSNARFVKGIDNVSLVQSSVEGFTLNGKTVLELGTGWHGVDLVIFHLLGAKSIITIDHYPHLTYANLISTIETLLGNPQVLNRLRGLNVSPDRISFLGESVGQTSSLTELLKLLAVDYQIVRSAWYKHLSLRQQPIDFFYSESVLQRIPIQHLRDLFRIVSGCLSGDGVAFHRTDQKDINSQRHVDTDLWALDYLRYSE